MSSETIDLNVAGMTCGGCEQSIARALSLLDEVESVEADFTTGRVHVTTTAPVERASLEAAVEDAGYDVLPDDAKRLPLL